ncbi:MAG: HAD family hydrolase [Desulfonatronovibrio sp.]
MKNNNGIIFDLDGTLLNTLQDLADSVNSVLAARGWPEHPVEAYRFFVGNGMNMLIRRAVPENVRNQDVLNQCTQAVRQEYSRRWAVKTAPYPGILHILDRLKKNGITMGVLSNKPHEATLETVSHFFPHDYFQVVQGALPQNALKPDPAAALDMAARMGKDPRQIYFLGDSNVDMLTACNANMIALGAVWGFRNREELIGAGAAHLLEKPRELSDYFHHLQ